jgi:hypothetical protein
MLRTHYSRRILMKHKTFLDNFRKILKYKLSLKSVQREQSCSMRTNVMTGIHDEANSRFSQSCERV